jgi:hypothetical protein
VGTEENCVATTGNTASLLWPPLPENVTVHHTVDLDTHDPTYTAQTVNAGQDKTSHRRCVATNHDRHTLRHPRHAHLTHLPQHGGRLSYDKAREAKRQRAAERERRAEQVLQLQKLGTRAVVAEVLVAEAEKVARTVRNLLDAGAKGDLNAAKALVPWIDQAYGKPTERVEHKLPSSVEELETMSEEQLERLVAQGRQRRLQGLRAVPDASDWRRRDPSLGVVGDTVDR